MAYDEQSADKKELRRELVAYFPLNERGSEIQTTLEAHWEQQQRIHEGADYDKDKLLSDDKAQALNDELESIVMQGYAELLADAPLTLTATFTDGTTQTKTYVIAPVDDFEEQWTVYREERSKSSIERLFSLAEPTLYTITEITE